LLESKASTDPVPHSELIKIPQEFVRTCRHENSLRRLTTVEPELAAELVKWERILPSSLGERGRERALRSPCNNNHGPTLLRKRSKARFSLGGTVAIGTADCPLPDQRDRVVLVRACERADAVGAGLTAWAGLVPCAAATKTCMLGGRYAGGRRGWWW
jgi:hypothetical protein